MKISGHLNVRVNYILSHVLYMVEHNFAYITPDLIGGGFLGFLFRFQTHLYHVIQYFTFEFPFLVCSSPLSLRLC